MTETTQRLNLNSPYAASDLSAFDDVQSLGGGVWVESRSQNDENSVVDMDKDKDKDLSHAVHSHGLESPRTMPPPFTQKKVSKFAKVPVSHLYI